MNLTRTASLVSSGLPLSQVATIVGVSPSRISQLLQQEDFKLLLAEQEASKSNIDVEEESISARYLSAEHVLLKQVIEMAPSAEMRDLTAALRVVGERQEKMKTRTLGSMAPVSHLTQTIVAINLPSHALVSPVIEINSANEVISIGDQSLAPLSSTAVTNLFKAMNPLKGEQHERTTSTRSTTEDAGKALPAKEAQLIDSRDSYIPSGSFLEFAL